ncbi:MAG: hypothetical protein ACRERU_21190 [Methylococcales bacterium]
MMTPLWNRYVFRRGVEAQDMWDQMFVGRKRPVALLYIGGRGFDVRAQVVMDKFISSLQTSGCVVEKAELVLVSFTGYQLSEDLKTLTEKNAKALESKFAPIGSTKTVIIGSSADDEDHVSVNNALRRGAKEVLRTIDNQTDILLDISSMPRIAYLSLLLGILEYLIVDREPDFRSLRAKDINFQVLVGEDAATRQPDHIGGSKQ